MFKHIYGNKIETSFGAEFPYLCRLVDDQTVKKSISGHTFMRSDVMRMLSQQFVRDNSLDMYAEALKNKYKEENCSLWKKVCIAPTAYHHILSLALAAKASTPSTRFRKVSNIDQYDYFLWPVNIGGYHWVLVVHILWFLALPCFIVTLGEMVRLEN